MQVSTGYIGSPEALTPAVNVRRTTASATHNRSLLDGNWQTTVAWGRNVNKPGETLDGYLVESSISVSDKHTFFGRAELADKDELFADDAPQAGQSFKVGKLSLGYIYDFASVGHLRAGIGALVSGYAIPASLEPTYGAHTTSYMLFMRLKLE